MYREVVVQASLKDHTQEQVKYTIKIRLVKLIIIFTRILRVDVLHAGNIDLLKG